MVTDGQIESSLTENQAHHETRKEFVEGSQCTYVFLYNSLRGLLTGAM
jgi:hypothetical protein